MSASYTEPYKRRMYSPFSIQDGGIMQKFFKSNKKRKADKKAKALAKKQRKRNKK